MHALRPAVSLAGLRGRNQKTAHVEGDQAMACEVVPDAVRDKAVLQGGRTESCLPLLGVYIFLILFLIFFNYFF